VDFDTIKQPEFSLLVGILIKPRVWLCLLDFGYIICGQEWIESECREDLVLDGLKKWN